MDGDFNAGGAELPEVSFAIASYNCAAFLEDAVRSALDQRGVSVEVVIVDDRSSDGSDKLAIGLAASDPRVRYFQTAVNAGPSGARNIALREARGAWIAVLDSDDLLHPDRSARLLAEAASSGADMVADDLLLFDDARIAGPRLFLGRGRAARPSWIGLADYLGETRMFARGPNLGFLKPMFRREFLGRHSLAYDPALRIAEDDALVVAALRAGARYRLLPVPLYFYRKHTASTSFKLGTGPADAMKAASDQLVRELAGSDRRIVGAMRRRAAAMDRAWAFTHLIWALKGRDFGQAGRLILRHPGMLPLLRQPVAARLARLRGDPVAAPAAPGPVAVIVSKQRLVGATNGSSSYLLAIAEELSRSGYAVHLVQPSDSLFGRTPFFRLSPAMAVFSSIRVAGAWRRGDRLVARAPGIWLGAARGVLARLAAKVGLAALLPDRKAAYAVATPWQRADLAFVAGQAGLRPTLIVADYVFCAEAFPYLLVPGACRVTIMHDQFSAREAQFGGEADSVAALTEAAEAALLARADAVIAIQRAEGDFVRRVAPRAAVLDVPMPADPVPDAQPGSGERVLFVGSDTAPNVIGLRWFLAEVWPALAAARPALTLDIAGSVGRAFDPLPPGVVRHGIVPDLGALYRAAGIVVSPLKQGSGLKIKLIDALAQGKACVVTGVTLQGAEWLAGDAVIQADSAEDFAAAILRLAGDEGLRTALGQHALDAAREGFGPERAFADLRAWLAKRSITVAAR